MSWVRARVAEELENGQVILKAERIPSGWPKEGSLMMIQVKNPRSSRFHRYYWSMLSIVADGTGMWHSKESLHDWLKEQMGHYTDYYEGGKIIRKLKSTSYESMDQDEFERYVHQCTIAICEATEINIEDLYREMENENIRIRPRQ